MNHNQLCKLCVVLKFVVFQTTRKREQQPVISPLIALPLIFLLEPYY